MAPSQISSLLIPDFRPIIWNSFRLRHSRLGSEPVTPSCRCVSQHRIKLGKRLLLPIGRCCPCHGDRPVRNPSFADGMRKSRLPCLRQSRAGMDIECAREKDAINRAKHGVSLALGAVVLENRIGKIVDDPPRLRRDPHQRLRPRRRPAVRLHLYDARRVRCAARPTG
jgi:hypothetical protein